MIKAESISGVMPGLLRMVLTVVSVALLTACSTTKTVVDGATGAVGAEEAVSGNLIVYYSPEVGNSDLLAAAERYGSKVIYVYRNFNGIAVSVPPGKSVDEAIKYYESVPGVLSVTRDRVLHLD